MGDPPMNSYSQNASCWKLSETLVALAPPGTLPVSNWVSMVAHSIGSKLMWMPTAARSCCSSSFMGPGIMFPDPMVG